MDISIIIPTLNEEKYLPKCLDSIAKQDYSGSYEVILGDGCSKDRTLKIAKEYGAKVVTEPKKTISAGRQKACEKAKGRIIVSTDADIIAPKDWLTKADKALEGCVGGFGYIVPYDGNGLETWMCKHVMDRWMWGMSAIRMPVPAGSNLYFQRKAFEKAGGFNTDLVTAEDLDLVTRLMKQGKVSYNPDSVVYVSLRRVQDWGYARYVLFHTTNAIKWHSTGKSHGEYGAVR